MLLKSLFFAGTLVGIGHVAQQAIDQARALRNTEAALVALASPQSLRDPATDARLHALQRQAQQLADVPASDNVGAK